MKPARREAYFSCIEITVEHSVKFIELLCRAVLGPYGRYTNFTTVSNIYDKKYQFVPKNIDFQANTIKTIWSYTAAGEELISVNAMVGFETGCNYQIGISGKINGEEITDIVYASVNGATSNAVSLDIRLKPSDYLIFYCITMAYAIPNNVHVLSNRIVEWY